MWSEDGPIYIIAEAGSNHDGKLGRGERPNRGSGRSTMSSSQASLLVVLYGLTALIWSGVAVLTDDIVLRVGATLLVGINSLLCGLKWRDVV